MDIIDNPCAHTHQNLSIDKACSDIDTSNVSSVLRRLLLHHNISPHELSFALSLSHKTVGQLLCKLKCRPEFSVLLALAGFFEITLGQLLGEDPIEYRGRPTEHFSFGICKFRLRLDCSEYVKCLLERHQIKISDERITMMTGDLYRYSLSGKKASVDEPFAKWCLARYANIRIEHLLGDELLDYSSAIADDETPVLDKKLRVQCLKLVRKLLAEYKVPPITKLAEIDSLISRMYDFNYSPSCSNRLIVDENYVGWYMYLLYGIPDENWLWKQSPTH